MQSMSKYLVIVLSIILIFLVIALSYDVDHFAENDGASSTVKDATDPNVSYVTQPQFNLLTSPILSSVNTMVDFINKIPNQLYDGSIGMATAIKSKIKEYGETMASYNKTPDDASHLSSIIINDRHKRLVDSWISSNDPLYGIVAKVASDFYTVPFDEQDSSLIAGLTTIATQNSKITPLLQAKLSTTTT